jgi:hypothetical protein
MLDCEFPELVEAITAGRHPDGTPAHPQPPAHPKLYSGKRSPGRGGLREYLFWNSTSLCWQNAEDSSQPPRQQHRFPARYPRRDRTLHRSPQIWIMLRGVRIFCGEAQGLDWLSIHSSRRMFLKNVVVSAGDLSWTHNRSMTIK